MKKNSFSTPSPPPQLLKISKNVGLRQPRFQDIPVEALPTDVRVAQLGKE
jgi:hypothetical protein